MRTGIILFNLGGPDGPAAVRPFLFNLFNDPAIIDVPGPIRWCLAKLISARRAPVARGIYANLGGRSPLLPNTRAQAEALTAALGDLDGEVRTFIAMRYWHPMADETAAEVAAWRPDRLVLLPLYPQFSTTTVQSSVDDWARAARRAGLDAATRTVCCYPTEPGFVAALAERIRPAYAAAAAAASGRPRVLFSAHGLPQKIVDGGDPYEWQVEQTAAATVAALDIAALDWTVCYQSHVGPLKWISPATEDEIRRAGADAVPTVVVPLAFVSEHSETLVELDIEYRELAERAGVPSYHRPATVDILPAFVAGLARLVRTALDRDAPVAGQTGGRLCPDDWRKCPCRGN